MNEFFIFNDKIFPSGTPVISVANRSFRYGDGIFETMKIVDGAVINRRFHFERLFHGLAVLKFDIPSFFNVDFLEEKIHALLIKNQHQKSARVRLSVFRGDGGIFDVQDSLPNYVIESWELPSTDRLNEKGLAIDIFSDAAKSCDAFSNLKSNNYLPSVMAGLYAKEHTLNESIIMNCKGNVCESATGNIFIVNKNEIFTPPLSDGCVAGVMRRWLLEKFSLKNYLISERSLSVADLVAADELFLTNSVYHLRWVKTFREKNYVNMAAKEIYRHVVRSVRY
ncbi:MAG TPA: aminotransferase class IV [Chitinophagaceae bacterium]|nr:aminotransferase class IV [Chitinophagaceae bacterium]